MFSKHYEAFNSKRIVILIIFLSLFINCIVLTCVGPVLPQFLYEQHKKSLKLHHKNISIKSNSSTDQYLMNYTKGYDDQEKQSYLKKINFYVGVIFASKPILQVISNLFFGPVVDRVGSSIPLFFGYLVMIFSSFLYALGTSYIVMLVARAIEGIGSSLIKTAVFCLLAETFVEDEERKIAISHALGGIALGIFVGPVYGSFVYSLKGKPAVFYIICGFLLILLLVQLLRMKIKTDKKIARSQTSSFKLFKDPYVLLGAFIMLVASIGIAVVETGMPIWMMKTMNLKKWKYGIAFLPYSVAYIVSTYLLGFLFNKIPNWFCCTLGIIFTGIGLLGLSFVKTFYLSLVPGFFIGLGGSLVDIGIFPIMAYLVDTRHNSEYGSVYAITDVAFCAAFAIGNLAGGALETKIGFPLTLKGMCCILFLFLPLTFLLRKPTKSLPSEDEKLKLLPEERQRFNHTK